MKLRPEVDGLVPLVPMSHRVGAPLKLRTAVDRLQRLLVLLLLRAEAPMKLSQQLDGLLILQVVVDQLLKLLPELDKAALTLELDAVLILQVEVERLLKVRAELDEAVLKLWVEVDAVQMHQLELRQIDLSQVSVELFPVSLLRVDLFRVQLLVLDEVLQAHHRHQPPQLHLLDHPRLE